MNAADAFDIGSFDEEDTKGIKLTDADQELYKNFPLTISERWQAEVAETVFETINNEADKVRIVRSFSNFFLSFDFFLRLSSFSKLSFRFS